MDEATASIDEKSDYILQKMIKTEFAEVSLILINLNNYKSLR